jgi:GTP-binding protein YchF
MLSNSLNRILLWQAKNGAFQKNWCGIGAEHTSLTPKTIENKGDLIYMKLGIVGLPNVGKSTLFNSLTKAGAESANYPFCTIDPNVGVVPVPDKRLKLLGDLYHSKKVTPAVIEFVDIAGLVKGASKGEGLGNQFLANIREVDAIVHVVRCFEDENVIHVEGSVDPLRDIETINLELIFSDLEILERRIAKTARSAMNDKSLAKELEILKELKVILEDGKLACTYENEDEDVMAFVNSLNLLTCKPVIFAANVGEEDLADDGASNSHVAAVREFAAENGSEVFIISAQIEQEIAELDDDEKQEYLEALGLSESGLDKLIAASYRLLGLISYLTSGEDETRAWTIKVGTKAPQAAGKIHSDFERGFIRAEVVNYQDLLDCGTYAKAKEKGLVGLEGKDYVVKDGDVILFRFNV